MRHSRAKVVNGVARSDLSVSVPLARPHWCDPGISLLYNPGAALGCYPAASSACAGANSGPDSLGLWFYQGAAGQGENGQLLGTKSIPGAPTSLLSPEPSKATEAGR